MDETERLKDRFRGAMLGLAVGDAIGTAVEFKAPGSFEPVTDMVGGGPFNLPVGAWTDDTSMALCLAESLIECGGFDPVDQLERYVDWFRNGHLSSTGELFDIGIATRASLGRFEETGESFPGDHFPDAAGNGSLMRLAPVALAFHRDPGEAERRAGESSRTTHGDRRAIDACRYFSRLLVLATDSDDRHEFFDHELTHPESATRQNMALHPEVEAIAAGWYSGKEPPEIKGGGFVIEALEAALWAFARSTDFEEGVLLAVNLGDDADTTAAIYGQLAGALYGADGIPSTWREKLVMGNRITAFADGLLKLDRA